MPPSPSVLQTKSGPSKCPRMPLLKLFPSIYISEAFRRSVSFLLSYCIYCMVSWIEWHGMACWGRVEGPGYDRRRWIYSRKSFAVTTLPSRLLHEIIFWPIIGKSLNGFMSLTRKPPPSIHPQHHQDIAEGRKWKVLRRNGGRSTTSESWAGHRESGFWTPTLCVVQLFPTYLLISYPVAPIRAKYKLALSSVPWIRKRS